MNVGVFYGSTMGTTKCVAESISELFGGASLHEVGMSKPADVLTYDLILLGSSTWGDGELQDDWFGFLDELKKLDLSGKKVGIFGCGDCVSYSDTFCDAIGIIYDELVFAGCSFVGKYVPDGYSVTNSKVCKDGVFVGLAIDENNESDKTAERVSAWVEQIKKEVV